MPELLMYNLIMGELSIRISREPPSSCPVYLLRVEGTWTNARTSKIQSNKTVKGIGPIFKGLPSICPVSANPFGVGILLLTMHQPVV